MGASDRPAALHARGRNPLATVTFAALVYLGSRLLFFGIAALDSLAQHTSLSHELSHWDGHWYLHVAAYGYPHAISTGYEHYSALGFLPLFPLLIWAVAHATTISLVGSGVIVSMVFGLIATVLVTRLATVWFGERASRRAVVFWSVFPGTIVFSMVYSEAVTVTLIAGALLAISARRWLAAGTCAALATAAAPIAIAIVPALLYCAVREARTRESHDRQTGRAVAAAVLSPLGLIAFAGFLWSWCGTPLASIEVQRGAWDNSTTPIALPERFGGLIGEIIGAGRPGNGPGGIDLYNIAALICTALLIYGLVLLRHSRDSLPMPVLIYTGCAALLMVTSKNAPPDPRMLINAFPVLLIVGAQTVGRRRLWLLGATILMTLVMSWLTLVGNWVLP